MKKKDVRKLLYGKRKSNLRIQALSALFLIVVVSLLVTAVQVFRAKKPELQSKVADSKNRILYPTIIFLYFQASGNQLNVQKSVGQSLINSSDGGLAALPAKSLHSQKAQGVKNSLDVAPKPDLIAPAPQATASNAVSFSIQIDTSEKATFVVRVHPEWAPLGADRFMKLIHEVSIKLLRYF